MMDSSTSNHPFQSRMDWGFVRLIVTNRHTIPRWWLTVSIEKITGAGLFCIRTKNEPGHSDPNQMISTESNQIIEERTPIITSKQGFTSSEGSRRTLQEYWWVPNSGRFHLQNSTTLKFFVFFRTSYIWENEPFISSLLAAAPYLRLKLRQFIPTAPPLIPSWI